MPGNKKNGKNKSSKIVRLKQKIREDQQSATKAREEAGGFSSKHGIFYFLYGLAVVAVSTLLLTTINNLATETYIEGEISHRNVYSLKDLVVVDRMATEQSRQRAFESVHDIYELNPEPLRSITERLETAFFSIERDYMENEPDAYRFLQRELLEYEETSDAFAQRHGEYIKLLRTYEGTTQFAELEKNFINTLGIPLEPRTIRTLRWHHYRPAIAQWLGTILKEIMERGVRKEDAFSPTGRGTIYLVGKGAPPQSGRVIGFEKILGMDDAIKYSTARIRELVPTQHPSLRREMNNIIRLLVVPNVSHEMARTQKVRNAARETVSPVYLHVKKNELIIRKGEKITPGHLLKLQGAKAGLEGKGRAQLFGGKFLAILLALFASWMYMNAFLPEFTGSRSNVALLGLLFILQAGLLRIFGAGASVFAAYNPDVMSGSYLYAAPFALFPLIAAIFFSREITVLATLVGALAAGLAFGQSFYYVMPALAGGMVAAFHVGRIKRRTDVWLAGLRLLTVSLGVIAITAMLENSLLTSETFYSLAFGALGALMVVALTLTLLPLIEWFFPVVSDIKLLELSDLNHTLLARMAVVAPGTYHHSVVVGNLAEDAAEAIGANPLLARVGAYFHDIGKIDKPEYFIENQRDGQNKHDNLNPSMSALIISSHVTTGLELAKEFKLIPQISDIIAEHHGTQLMLYFYKRAKEQENAEISTVSKQDYRYNGQRPRTRESAVVALADSVEAASRALNNPTSSRIRQLVSRIIEQKFVSDELDDSNLTIHDLRKIGDSFVRILHGIFHYRVEYPDNENEENIDTGQAGNKGAKPDEDKRKAGPDIKRAG